MYHDSNRQSMCTRRASSCVVSTLSSTAACKSHQSKVLSKVSLSMDADLARLEIQLNHITSKHDLSVEEVLEEWVERQKSYDSESWRLLDGLPCIMGSLTTLCGNLSGQGLNFPWKTLPTFLGKNGLVLYNYPEDCPHAWLLVSHDPVIYADSHWMNHPLPLLPPLLPPLHVIVLAQLVISRSLTLPHCVLILAQLVVSRRHALALRVLVLALLVVSAGPSHCFKEASPGPSHRLKMTQMPPPAPIVRGVDARELILGIACLTQNSTVMEATGDAMDELEMAAYTILITIKSAKKSHKAMETDSNGKIKQLLWCHGRRRDVLGLGALLRSDFATLILL
ncbi:uncharacterized protein BJ212DRAFT_1298752 [Suillus subaureus]|uniref:Uncharacterized protein n=1 Tax=Suillus subaureus TaxID=48587 RepID=A0A9P7JF39_9AGAM|nr:uncharacterized protein BJ212DRAFT_1298752 [Suillus subaureus]KAG1818702.1 hypothetical protein BJ212DRAFT_1298752 [Suillus subaureus]